MYRARLPMAALLRPSRTWIECELLLGMRYAAQRIPSERNEAAFLRGPRAPTVIHGLFRELPVCTDRRGGVVIAVLSCSVNSRFAIHNFRTATCSVFMSSDRR